ncbi:MAG: carbamoyltransferase, partial [Proteobacteria bacterium]|nr:carbamoyltransferase [Pseudomonadota bacterium]
VNTERLSRIKKHPGVTKEAFDLLLKNARISPAEIDYIVLNNLNYMFSPDFILNRGSYEQDSWEEILIECQEDHKDESTSSISKDSKKFVDVKNFGVLFEPGNPFPRLNNNRINYETHAFFRGFRRQCLVNPPHYLLHASTVYYSSPFKSAIIFVWDPTGFEAFVGKDNKIHQIFNDRSLNMVNLGSVYAEVSNEVMSEGSLTSAGKMMGLSPYGKRPLPKEALEYDLFLDDNRERLFSFLKESSENNPIFYKEKNINLNCGKAFLTQSIFENQLSYIFKLLYQYSLSQGIEPNICLSGGSALNCIANEKAFKSSKFKNIFLHPACGDDGTSIGGGMYLWHQILDNKNVIHKNKELMYSTRNYSAKEIKEALDLYKDQINILEDTNYIEVTSHLLSNGKIIAWFDGESEIGPRALGHRSILADARSNTIRDFINNEIKQRETFRPFAPSILKEHSLEWFGIDNSPFMLRAAPILKNILPGISHVDGTSRPQTVDKEDNPTYHKLILSFFNRTNIPMILNTSFNIKGEPIVETPKDAIRSFLSSKIDVLVFPNLIIKKK